MDSVVESPTVGVRVRWGWFALRHGLNYGDWLEPAEASDLLGISTASLRRWSGRGLITTVIEGPRKHRRYFEPELEIVMVLACNVERPNMHLLTRHIKWVTANEGRV